ncbi:hypothetical protein [Tuwongella immobilis]|uniref:MetA-pathway of phenol degradation n=1 Tax=Tuwongella immobilis TaxID=692036 RepID=A0A6C2YQE0_9BACT|nr:hypothetical protein [Tuwongella immobilis]VIP03541.1 Uncharacterized protein OS=Isosphaera pallida (strain ATCC 43644 / DSM 9630 / IS1B) GN=Isop_1318 PE=4 SV=1 [Tuwongella immobilis]VTS04450.1 Uncharacterized protein OS=Isosphaera pallida (strain ATCC 43644 / DSM 9630 / IS1B) GN=Isop_1318 PE=4 SV=1 [Tuwongella immobilis]
MKSRSLLAGFTLGLVSWLGNSAIAQEIPSSAPTAAETILVPGSGPIAPSMPSVVYESGTPYTIQSELNGTSTDRSIFQSDHAFDGFITPISNPVLSKDPRANTFLRGLFIWNQIPNNHPLAGNAQIYAVQANLAITERFSLLAEKDGYAVIDAKNGSTTTEGWLSLNFGFKYALIRDVENQFLFTVGSTIEVPTGAQDVLQNDHSGITTVFATVGKEFGDGFHFLNTTGYQFGFDSKQTSNFFYSSFHLDKQVAKYFYPLIEMNWFGYTGGGDNGLPLAIGEGDGLLNFGTTGMGGQNYLFGAVGLRVVPAQALQAGIAYEFPLSDQKGLLQNRLTCDLIIRY